MDLTELGEQDVVPIQELFESWPMQFERLAGTPVTASAAHALYIQVPDGVAYEDKHVLGLREADGHLSGVIDGIAHYPRPGVLTVGLCFAPLCQDIVQHLERWAIAQSLRVIHVVAPTADGTDTRPDWEACGYQKSAPEGHVLEKSLYPECR